MTGRTFKWQVIGPILVVIVLSVLAVGASYRWDPYKEGLRAVPAILIPIGAAWLAFCWQRRVAFTKALFDVWQKTVITIQDAIQYTFLEAPSQTDYAKMMHSLSCRIDDIRGAFRNVGEPRISIDDRTKQYILLIKSSKTLAECAKHTKEYRDIYAPGKGVYPFESLQQIQRVISRLGYGGSFTSDNSKMARKTIVSLWQVLRGELLKELDRDFPEHPDTPYVPR